MKEEIILPDWFEPYIDEPENYNNTFAQLLQYIAKDRDGDRREAALLEIEARAIKAAHIYTTKKGYINHASMTYEMVADFMKQIK